MNPFSSRYLGKIVQRTIFYLVIVSILFAIITPVFFLVSLSFLSTREAYRFPLPLLPTITTKLKLEPGERGVLFSVYDRIEEDYRTILDTSDPEKIQVYMKSNLNTFFTIEEIGDLVDRVESEGVVYFEKRANIFNNFITFMKVAGTGQAVPALLRSLQICAITIVISLAVGGLAGYAFARYNFVGKDALKFSVLFVRMFPGVAIAMPMLYILSNMGFYDRPIGLSLVYAVGSVALTVWITASIFLGIPVSLEEAAQVFGATRAQTFMRITFPLALPGLAAAAMYAFLGAWNETVAAIILTQFNPTFSVIVYQTVLGAVGQVNLAAAGGVLMALPAVVFTFFIRRYIHQMWGGITV